MKIKIPYPVIVKSDSRPKLFNAKLSEQFTKAILLGVMTAVTKSDGLTYVDVKQPAFVKAADVMAIIKAGGTVEDAALYLRVKDVDILSPVKGGEEDSYLTVADYCTQYRLPLTFAGDYYWMPAADGQRYFNSAQLVTWTSLIGVTVVDAATFTEARAAEWEKQRIAKEAAQAEEVTPGE